MPDYQSSDESSGGHTLRWAVLRRSFLNFRVTSIVGVGVIVFLLLPLVILVPLSFSSDVFMRFPPPGYSLQWYESFFTSDRWRRATVNSVKIATGSMILSTIIGTLTAFPIVRENFRGKSAVVAVLASPLIVPEIAIAVGLFVVLLPLGLTDRWWVVSLGQSVLNIPFATLVIAAALRGFDRSLEDAARSLGASSPRVLLHVTLPGIRPAIVTAMAFTWIFSLNDLLIPLFLASIETTPLTVLMWTSLRTRLDLTTLSISVLWVGLAVVMLIAMEITRRRTATLRERVLAEEAF